MSLSTRLQTSSQLLSRSLAVMRSNPRLFWFPAVSVLSALILAAFFLAPIFAVGIASTRADEWTHLAQRMNAPLYAYGAFLYLVFMFVATFFNVAFYHEIMRALAGESVSLGHGLRFASSRLRAILMWSLLAGTVGLVIRMIEERLGWFGKIVMGLVGAVWSVAVVFAIPVIIRRTETNPITVLRDSAATVKRTWGESLVGFVGIRLVGVMAILGLVVCGVFTVRAMRFFHAGSLIVVAIVGWALAIAACLFVVGIATHVYRCALYVYASEGVVPGPFTVEMMDAAWKVKKA